MRRRHLRWKWKYWNRWRKWNGCLLLFFLFRHTFSKLLAFWNLLLTHFGCTYQLVLGYVKKRLICLNSCELKCHKAVTPDPLPQGQFLASLALFPGMLIAPWGPGGSGQRICFLGESSPHLTHLLLEAGVSAAGPSKECLKTVKNGSF